MKSAGLVRLRRWVMIAGSALIALIIATDSYEAWQDYRRVISDNEHVQAALSRAVAEQTARMIEEVDLALAAYTASDPPQLQRLEDRIAALPFVQSVSFIQGSEEVQNRLQISAPAASARDPATFGLSRPLRTGEGTAVGVLTAHVSCAYLAHFYAQVNITPDTLIRLQRDDGLLLARYPPAAAVEEAGAQIAVSRHVDTFPALVAVSRSRSHVLQPWVQEERSSAARTLSLAVLAAILLLTLRAALNRQERADQEKHALEQNLAAAQRVEALGFLAASVAHDFNNVLTAIIGYAELIREAQLPQPELGVNVDRLLGATERARLLVRRVLTFDPRRSPVHHPIQVGPLAAEVCQQIRASLPQSLQVTLEAMDDGHAIMGDPTEIHQIIMNLCSNSVHAMPDGGSLSLRLEAYAVPSAKSLALGRLEPGQWLRLTVADTGVGFPAEHMQSIFEPFYTTRQAGQGTGIGLTVVRNLVLRMGGAVDVSSRLGSGTAVAVYWPAVADASTTRPTAGAPMMEAPAAQEPAAESSGNGETIMVIDDERELVTLTEELLASCSYEPVGYSDARAALEAFRHDPQRFDAVLTDERMQPMRGLELAALIHRCRSNVPIILMTAHRDADIVLRAAEFGIVDILDKPLRAQTLRDALARHLGRAPPRRNVAT